MMHYVGVDVSKDKVNLCWLRDADTYKIKTKSFPKQDREKLGMWLGDQITMDFSDITAVFSPKAAEDEGIIYYLSDALINIRIGDPEEARSFAKEHGFKHRPGKDDAKVLAFLGSQNPEKLQEWEPLPMDVRDLRKLIELINFREKQCQGERDELERAKFDEAPEMIFESIEGMLDLYSKQIDKYRRMVQEIISENPEAAEHPEVREGLKGIQ